MYKSVDTLKQRSLKILVTLLGFLSILLICYLIFLPFYPLLKYQFLQSAEARYKLASRNKINLSQTASSSQNHLPEFAFKIKPQITAAEIVKSPNRVIIKKIGVDIPIVEAPEAKYRTALNRGAWRVPQTSTPEQGSNTVISAHRYKYLPPNNLTFYLLDKLASGDIINVIWKNKEYDYRVKASKIVSPTEISILNPTDKPILTLFTCDPIWSEKNRLVVTAELIE